MGDENTYIFKKKHIFFFGDEYIVLKGSMTSSITVR